MLRTTAYLKFYDGSMLRTTAYLKFYNGSVLRTTASTSPKVDEMNGVSLLKRCNNGQMCTYAGRGGLTIFHTEIRLL